MPTANIKEIIVNETKPLDTHWSYPSVMSILESTFQGSIINVDIESVGLTDGSIKDYDITIALSNVDKYDYVNALRGIDHVVLAAKCTLTVKVKGTIFNSKFTLVNGRLSYSGGLTGNIDTYNDPIFLGQVRSYLMDCEVFHSRKILSIDVYHMNTYRDIMVVVMVDDMEELLHIKNEVLEKIKELTGCNSVKAVCVK